MNALRMFPTIGAWGAAGPALKGPMEIGSRGKADIMCDGLNAFAPSLQVADRDVAPQGIFDRLKRRPV